MAIKYISKNKDGLWKIATTKTGKAIKTFNTQKEAIAYAGTIKSTESIMIKRESGWTVATGWDLNVANAAKSVEKHSKAQGVTSKHAKATAVANALDVKPMHKDEPTIDVAESVKVAKKELKSNSRSASSIGYKSSNKGLYISLVIITLAAIAGFLVWWFVIR